MVTPFDELKEANAAYHAAVNNILCIEVPSMPIDRLTNVKAKFGALHNNIFQLMTEAQTLLEPYFEGGE